MAHRSSDVERNRQVVSFLDLQPGDRVLEAGLFEAGLKSARVETPALEPPVVCVLARAPSQPETEVTQ
jgi:hypothetical protein